MVAPATVMLPNHLKPMLPMLRRYRAAVGGPGGRGVAEGAFVIHAGDCEIDATVPVGQMDLVVRTRLHDGGDKHDRLPPGASQ